MEDGGWVPGLVVDLEGVVASSPRTVESECERILKNYNLALGLWGSILPGLIARLVRQGEGV